MQRATTDIAVDARDLGRRFGRRWALAHVDLSVHQGEAILLAGHNGSGKTTFLRMVAGLTRPTRGELRVLGREVVRERLAARRTVSMVAHRSYLWERLSPLETLRVWSRLLGRQTDDGVLRRLLDEVELGRASDTPAGGLSAGMRKRLTLLRILLEEPRVLLLDEPFSALDEQGRQWVEQRVRTFAAAGGTLILASHDVERAASVCDRTVFLHAGQVRWVGPADRSGEYRGELS